jgi:hypothetical protein
MKRLIIFLIRRRLGLKKWQRFQFTNQKTDNLYYFTSTEIKKVENSNHTLSSVSLNWLLSDKCDIKPVSM